jgi:hypothetical protein
MVAAMPVGWGTNEIVGISLAYKISPNPKYDSSALMGWWRRS